MKVGGIFMKILLIILVCAMLTAALRMSVTAMVLVAASIVLKHFGWWAVIPVFALSAAVSAKGYKAISKRKPVKN